MFHLLNLLHKGSEDLEDSPATSEISTGLVGQPDYPLLFVLRYVHWKYFATQNYP